ncbi:MAG: WbqC family protein [Bacteroidales bacterium]|nr:WbqC family protein [Bacteroidales bacterium]
MSLLLSTAYLPPLDYFAAIAKDASLEGEIAPARLVLEACENYRKQSWRNRCTILSASGRENLLVPIRHTSPHIPIREVEVDYSTPWVHLHENALSTAYGSSAFFEHYRDGLFDILESREVLLYDLNRRLLDYLLEKLHLPAVVEDSADYRPETDVLSEAAEEAASMLDLRTRLSPKKAPLYAVGEPYYQIFSSKFGFTEGLSVVDLLFNEGPDSLNVLAGMHVA